MSVLFFWIGNNYREAISYGKGYHLNQNNELIYKLKSGEHIWAFTRREDKTYVLALDMVVVGTKLNNKGDPGYEYGMYHADGDRQSSRYFNVTLGVDIDQKIRSLSFFPKAKVLGHSFQGRNGVRKLTAGDEQILISFASSVVSYKFIE